MKSVVGISYGLNLIKAFSMMLIYISTTILLQKCRWNDCVYLYKMHLVYSYKSFFSHKKKTKKQQQKLAVVVQIQWTTTTKAQHLKCTSDANFATFLNVTTW